MNELPPPSPAGVSVQWRSDIWGWIVHNPAGGASLGVWPCSMGPDDDGHRVPLCTPADALRVAGDVMRWVTHEV